jgi:hypothetical protein
VAYTHPAIIDPEGNQRNLYSRNSTLGNASVLGLAETSTFQLNLENTTLGPNPQVERKLGTVVPTVGLSEQSKIVVLVGGELGIERL